MCNDVCAMLLYVHAGQSDPLPRLGGGLKPMQVREDED